MATQKQVYDAEGTTHYHCSMIVKEGNSSQQWMLQFAQGYISIYSASTGLHIRLNYPREEHWTYEYEYPAYRDGAIQRGAILKTSNFTLQADVREYLDPKDPDFDPENDDTGDPQGYLTLSSNNMTNSMHIPYKVALAIMKFASGSTDLDGARNVIKYKK